MKITYTVQDPRRTDSLRKVVRSREFIGGEYTVELDTWWASVKKNGVVVFAIRSNQVEEVTQ